MNTLQQAALKENQAVAANLSQILAEQERDRKRYIKAYVKAQRQRTQDGAVPAGMHRGKRIDLGLELAKRHLKYDHPMTLHQIACFCGCTDEFIAQLERKALRRALRIWQRMDRATA